MNVFFQKKNPKVKKDLRMNLYIYIYIYKRNNNNNTDVTDGDSNH
jgi:hypothetical protein